MPHVEVRSRRVGGATFQIPMPIRPDRKNFLRYQMDDFVCKKKK